MNGGPSFVPRAGAVFSRLRRTEVALLTLSRRFHRIVSRCLVDVPALGALEDPQIRTVGTGLKAGQHHATLARRAERPQYRNERWFETSISFGEGVLLFIWREHAAPPAVNGSRFDGCDRASMPLSTASHCSILL